LQRSEVARMAQTSVTQFAGELKVKPQVLLEQLRAAGVNKKVAEDLLSEQDKTRLLEYLRKSHGAAEPKTKITLTRKETSAIRKADSSGKSRTIQVEVRKKRVFVKRDATETTPAPMPEVPEAPPAPATLIDEREAELREAEKRRQEELAARQAAEVAERQERERRLAARRPARNRPRPPTRRCTGPRPGPPRRRPRSRSSRSPFGATRAPSVAPSRRGATREAVAAAGTSQKSRDIVLRLPSSRPRSFRPPSRWCATSTFPRRSQWGSSPTRCRSRPPRSSRC
jgi:translation initiation factor IF-2